MEQDQNIERIRLISEKKWSGFKTFLSAKSFTVKPNGGENFGLIVFFFYFFTKIFDYSEEKKLSDLTWIAVYTMILIWAIYTHVFSEKSANRTTVDFISNTITIDSKYWLKKLLRKSITVPTNKVESIYCVNLKRVSRVFITIDNKETIMFNVRKRKNDENDTLDTKTDGEIVAECLENIIINNRS
ncbi:MAG: hypothetical protein ACPGVD_10920 [Flavobacteriales bacterium]